MATYHSHISICSSLLLPAKLPVLVFFNIEMANLDNYDNASLNAQELVDLIDVSHLRHSYACLCFTDLSVCVSSALLSPLSFLPALSGHAVSFATVCAAPQLYISPQLCGVYVTV